MTTPDVPLSLDPRRTALLLIGYQNDYFHDAGALHAVVEEGLESNRTLEKTLGMLDALAGTATLAISTPILFTPDYDEVVEPIGILGTIVEAKAFREGAWGGRTVSELEARRAAYTEVPGKRGLNAFSNTRLETLLRERGVQDVLVAGVVTSLCIDSTARHAFELGFRVGIVSDCIAGRTAIEQAFYLEQVFPLYGRVLDSGEVLQALGAGAHPDTA